MSCPEGATLHGGLGAAREGGRQGWPHPARAAHSSPVSLEHCPRAGSATAAAAELCPARSMACPSSHAPAAPAPRGCPPLARPLPDAAGAARSSWTAGTGTPCTLTAAWCCPAGARSGGGSGRWMGRAAAAGSKPDLQTDHTVWSGLADARCRQPCRACGQKGGVQGCRCCGDKPLKPRGRFLGHAPPAQLAGADDACHQ